MPAPTDREQIHPRRIVFDGTINAGHVLTFLSLLAALAVGWTTMDKRVVVLERDNQHQQARDAAQDIVVKEGIVELKGMVRDIQKSVDAVRQSQQQRHDSRP